MRNLTLFFVLLFFNSFYYKSYSQNIDNLEQQFKLSNFVKANYDSIFYKKDTLVYSLWYPEESILVLVFTAKDKSTFYVRLKDFNSTKQSTDSVVVALNRISQFDLNKTRLLKIFLESELYYFTHKNRTYEKYQELTRMSFWQDNGIQIVPDWGRDCRGYPFNVSRGDPIPNDLMRLILFKFADM